MKVMDAVTTLDALAQASRLEIFRFLMAVGPDGAAAGRIAGHIDIHAATLSFHLNTLRQAGLVQSRRVGRSIIYTANFARMDDLVSFLTANCCRGVTPRERVRNRVAETA
jgi:predicted transcriptional regulator